MYRELEKLEQGFTNSDQKDYINAYTGSWIFTTCGKIYDNSLDNKPREITNSYPWTPETQSEKNKRLRGNAPGSISMTSKYINTYRTFSGHDMVCIFELPYGDGGTIVKVIGTLQTVTYSIHNEKTPVRCLGDMNPKGYVFGPRTIAGTLIFTVFNKHWAKEMIEEYLGHEDSNAHMLTDEFPPLNITVSCANEYGAKARLAIYGVTFVNEGQVMSINDVYTENTYQFFATDVDYLTDNKHASGGTTVTP